MTRYSLRPLGWLLASLVMVTGVASFSGSVAADTDDAVGDTSETLIHEALHRELYGLQKERDQLLADALKLDPENPLAKWHMGRMRHESEWVDAEAVTAAADTSPIMKEYQQRRESMADTLDAHWSMSTWCRDNKLPGQERAHLCRVLDFETEHAAARERLGFRMIAGEWVSRDEMQASAERREKEAIASGKWGNLLREILRDLQSGDAHRAANAPAKLSKIKTLHAIPAMESMLSSSEAGALAVVDRVARMQGPEPTMSLVRHAVFSSSIKVREKAADQLAYRKRESYVPTLLQEMYLPVESQFGVAIQPNGRYGYRHIFQREGQEERQFLILDTDYRRQRRLGGNGNETLVRAFLDSCVGIAQREMATAQQNVYQTALNERISDTLNIATKQELPPDPSRWWQWWDEENDTVRLGDKRLRSRQNYQQVTMTDRSSIIFTGTSASETPRAECFVAGTGVLTRNGMTPIELIRVGDLVLSQDIESGELAFKPVLRTTVRPAGELVKVQVGRDTFQTSRGHLFWAPGQGWVKSRHLESGMQLHTMHGSLPVSLVEKGANAETFNLVVADFHTYFVGHERVLSHDVTSRQATSATMPGVQGN